MKRKFYLEAALTIFVLAAAFQIAGSDSLLPTHEKSQTYSKRVEATPGQWLYIDDTHADITVTGTNKNEIRNQTNVDQSIG